MGVMSVLNYSPSKKKLTANWSDKEYYTRVLNQQIANDKITRSRTQPKKSEETLVEKEDTNPIEKPAEYRSSDRAILGEGELGELRLQVADLDELYFIGGTNASSFKANLTKQGIDVETVSREEINIPSIHIYRVLKEKTKEYYKYVLYVVSKHTIEFPHLDSAFIQFSISGISFKNCRATDVSISRIFNNMNLDFINLSGLDISMVERFSHAFENVSGIVDNEGTTVKDTLITLSAINNFLKDKECFSKSHVKFELA